MEALFSTTLASYEAWLMVLCVIIFLGIYLFDGISFIQRVYIALRPAKPQGTIAPVASDTIVPEVTSPILEPIAPEEVEAHDREKAIAEEKHEQDVLESEVFEEKILEEIQLAEEAEKIEKAKEVETMEMTEKVEQIDKTAEVEQEETKEDIQEDIQTEEIATKDVPEESQDVIENDLEQKEKIEDEPLDIREEKVKKAEGSEAVVNTNEIEEAKEVEMIENIEGIKEVQEATIETEESVSVVSSKALPESSDITQEQDSQELNPEVEITEEKDTEEKSSENTADTTKEVTPSEESRAMPITASIPEAKAETKKSTESQYTERLYTIVSEVKTLLARGHPQDARALIIQGLALDKNHRELNLILGSIYESERQAQKAEYIYKDLALVYPEDGEILERLANILIIEKRYDLALEIYKKIISLSGETEGSLYIMTHLAHELGHNEELYAYARRYQKNWPNNPDILTLLAQAEIALGERQAAIQTLIKLKNLTPYNNEIMETIAKLTMEEELAGNFGN